jgi:hypothetical protein
VDCSRSRIFVADPWRMDSPLADIGKPARCVLYSLARRLPAVSLVLLLTLATCGQREGN